MLYCKGSIIIIIDFFAGFVMREMASKSPSPSAIKFCLRNKLTALDSRRSKKEHSWGDWLKV